MKFGIIGALSYEVDLLIGRMECVQHAVRAGVTFHSGTLNGKAAVVAVSGIGKVNAALCTQLMISEFAVTHVINSGVAGALKDHLEPGDVVVSTDLAQHDVDVSDGGGYAAGQIPGMQTSFFKADQTLADLAFKLLKDKATNHKIYCDRIVSGDIFVANAVKKADILNKFDAAATEMEGAAVAHVCYLNAVHFVVIRAISDKADGSADTDFDTFAKDAAKNSALLVERMLGEL